MISIIQKEKRCAVCGKAMNLHCHHVLFGKNRKKSDKDGLMVWLCYEHHEGTNGVHGKNGKELDIKLKQIAEWTWIEHYGKSKEDFIKRFGKSYL